MPRDQSKVFGDVDKKIVVAWRGLVSNYRPGAL